MAVPVVLNPGIDGFSFGVFVNAARPQPPAGAAPVGSTDPTAFPNWVRADMAYKETNFKAPRYS
jgi:hypothetical protein